MKKKKNAEVKTKTQSIATKIKRIMMSSSISCLGALGIVSMIGLTVNSNSMLNTTMSETAEVAANLVGSEIDTMKQIAYEIGSNSVLGGKVSSDEDKLEVLFQRVETYGFSNAGLTLDDNIDLVSGWDCSQQDTVVRARAGEVYISEPKIKDG